MAIKKEPPIEPINTTTTNCKIVIFGIHRTVLKISPHCWKRNEEFRQSKKKKVRESLNQYLLSKKEIKELVQQINEKEVWFEGINTDWPAWKYYGYKGAIDKRNGLVYL
ncbi:MAG: hypothetical protein I3273_05500 [Candidatus Moeniiplasma glomeromycotorum]|nr:hypothetical protein [Candidatus Moeniiplasma glomeromycotorum]MCE8169545.1 hypothetical protein [Candidatus Moeniiplasma glomeromycotorum]